jgi:hypothetical protein
MLEKGFSLNAAGYWIASKMPDHLKVGRLDESQSCT